MRRKDGRQEPMYPKMSSSTKSLEASWYWKSMKYGYIRIAILRVLKERGMHGYEMMKQIGNRTGGILSPTAGSAYPILRDLETSGYVRSKWATSKGKRKKRVYEITKKGLQSLSKFDEVRLHAAKTLKSSIAKAAKALDVEQGEVAWIGMAGRFAHGRIGGQLALFQKAAEAKTDREKIKFLNMARSTLRERISFMQRREEMVSKQIEYLQHRISSNS